MTLQSYFMKGTVVTMDLVYIDIDKKGINLIRYFYFAVEFSSVPAASRLPLSLSLLCGAT